MSGKTKRPESIGQAHRMLVQMQGEIEKLEAFKAVSVALQKQIMELKQSALTYQRKAKKRDARIKELEDHNTERLAADEKRLADTLRELPSVKVLQEQVQEFEEAFIYLADDGKGDESHYLMATLQRIKEMGETDG